MFYRLQRFALAKLEGVQVTRGSTKVGYKPDRTHLVNSSKQSLGG